MSICTYSWNEEVASNQEHESNGCYYGQDKETVLTAVAVHFPDRYPAFTNTGTNKPKNEMWYIFALS